MAPAASSRSPFFSAAAPERLRRSTSAFSISPPASSRAFLHCIIETPVRSRSALSRSVVISMLFPIIQNNTCTGKQGMIPRAHYALAFLTHLERSSQFTKHERYGSARRIVGDDWERRYLQVIVGAHDTYDRDTRIIRFLRSMRLALRVHNYHRIRPLRK